MDKLETLEELFAGRHFDREVIILCVRWYLRFNQSLRDLAEMDPSHDGHMSSDRRRSAIICPCDWSVAA
jgi:hypothetical protein